MAELRTYHFNTNNALLYSLIICIFIMGEKAFGAITIAIAILLSLAGFAVSSSIINNAKNRAVNAGIDIANIIIFIWIATSIMHSSFIFERVITSLSRGILFIIAALSFNPAYKRNRMHIHNLLFTLLIMYPLILKTNSLFYQVFLTICVILWIADSRFSLYKFSGINRDKILRTLTFALAAIVIILPLVYALKTRIHFPKVKQTYVLLRTRKLNIENELYKLQNQLYKKSMELGTKQKGKTAYGSKEGIGVSNQAPGIRGRIISYLSSLFQESPYTLKVEKARLGLKDIFHRPGPGLEKGTEGSLIITALNKYVDIKAKVNTERANNKLTTKIKNNINRLGMKLSAMLKMNSINYNNNTQQVTRDINSLSNMASSISNPEERKSLEKAVEELRRWKLYSMYNAARRKVENSIENSEIYNYNLEDKNNVLNLLNSIEETLSLSKIYSLYNGIEEALDSIEPKSRENIKDGLKNMVEIKTELILTENLNSLIRKLEESSVPDDIINKIYKQAREIINSESGSEFLRYAGRLKDTLEKNKLLYILKDNNMQKIIFGKAEALKGIKTIKVRKLLDKSALIKKSKKQIIKLINRALYSKNAGVIDKTSLIKRLQNILPEKAHRDIHRKLTDYINEMRVITKTEKIAREWKQQLSLNSKITQNKAFEITESGLLSKAETVKSLKVTPLSKTISAGEKAVFKATAIYNDGTKRDVTNSVSWQSSDYNKTLIGKGLVTALAKGKVNIQAYWKEVKSNRSQLIINPAELISISLNYGKIRLPWKETISIKATGHFTDKSIKDITGLSNWYTNNKEIAESSGKGVFKAKKPGKAIIYCKYSGIQSPSVEISVFIPLLDIVKTILFYIVTILSVVSIILYITIKIKAAKIRNIVMDNPSRLIEELFNNLKNVLNIFGLHHKNTLPPLQYAAMVNNSFSIESNVFFELADKFSEARYSRHTITQDDAVSFIEKYNKGIENIRRNTKNILIKYLLLLIHRLPFTV